MIEFDYEYTKEEFLKQYNLIKSYLISGKESLQNRKTILINGQPGSGKSNYETKLLKNNIIINTDEFRKFHPRIDVIKKLDGENYVERTQVFASNITEKLIDELSIEKYNLVIEGTLRTAEIPINTCNKLKANGYCVDLIVIACDACQAWESTINRANELISHHEKPRLVPIDKYDYNIQHIADNLKTVRERGCFDSISIVSRNGKFIDSKGIPPEEILKKVLNIEKWNQNKNKYEGEYLRNKIKIIKQEINNRGL